MKHNPDKLINFKLLSLFLANRNHGRIIRRLCVIRHRFLFFKKVDQAIEVGACL